MCSVLGRRREEDCWSSLAGQPSLSGKPHMSVRKLKQDGWVWEMIQSWSLTSTSTDTDMHAHQRPHIQRKVLVCILFWGTSISTHRVSVPNSYDSTHINKKVVSKTRNRAFSNFDWGSVLSVLTAWSTSKQAQKVNMCCTSSKKKLCPLYTFLVILIWAQRRNSPTATVTLMVCNGSDVKNYQCSSNKYFHSHYKLGLRYYIK